ncbi:MAG: ATP-dependent zinc protease, partial [Myxococcales bacterium]|nr:ATP-dependent zinc protease [Myxococcales bacterium]
IMGRKHEKVVIGWTESVEFPDWNIGAIRAKIDTGARTSALHVEDIEETGRGRVRFDVILHRAKRDRHVHVTAPITRRARVRSSNGEYEERYFVETILSLGPLRKRIEISLVDRGEMRFRMLLGRTALAGVWVDVAHANLLGRKARRKSAKRRPVRRS